MGNDLEDDLGNDEVYNLNDRLETIEYVLSELFEAILDQEGSAFPQSFTDSIIEIKKQFDKVKR